MANEILEGIRVLDMTVYQLGPLNTMMLAAMGAEVIKIEPPSGEMSRSNARGRVLSGGEGKGSGGLDLSAYFEYLNRCKKSIVLDLSKLEAREMLYQLVAKSDVFAQNIRPGAAEKLGCGYETLKKYNPNLIYYTGSSYGTKGPDRLKPGMDMSGAARAGFMHMTHSKPGEPGRVTGVCDQMGGIIGAFTIVGALLARERFGGGQFCETSHTTATMWLLGTAIQAGYYMGRSPGYDVPREECLLPTHNYYKCGDGEWIAIVCSNPRHWGPICQALDIPDSVRDDPRFITDIARGDHARETVALLDEYFAKKPREEWVKAFEGKDINWERIQRWTDLAADPTIIANEYMSDYTHPLNGVTYKYLNLPMQLSETPILRHGRAPLLGEHTEEILVNILGYKKEDVPKLLDEIGRPNPTPPSGT
ncbi:CaiB/BaiF CoA transferase family protein [Chloroflexota bacterium]